MCSSAVFWEFEALLSVEMELALLESCSEVTDEPSDTSATLLAAGNLSEVDIVAVL